MRLLLVGLLAAAVLAWPARWSVAGLLAGPLLGGRSDAADADGTTDGADGNGGGQRATWRRGPDRWRRRSGRLEPRDVLALLEGLAPALGAGLAPSEALALLVRLNLDQDETAHAPAGWREQLVDIGERARDGQPLAPAWRRLARHHGSPELMLMAQAWTLSERLGSSLSEAVATATDLVRDRLRSERRVTAASAGARATMNLLTLLPLGGAAVAAMLGISPVALYTRSPLALGCLLVGAALLLIGRLMVRRMVRRSLRPAGTT